MSWDMSGVEFNNKRTSAESVAGGYESSIVIYRWLGTCIDLVVLVCFLLLPDYLLGNALYNQTLFVWLGLIVLYFPVMETMFGRTVGKFVARTRVVNATGGKPSWGQSIVRTLFRLIEVNPLLFGGIPAGIVVMLSSKRQRLGDMVAGTYVLKDVDALQIAAARSV